MGHGGEEGGKFPHPVLGLKDPKTNKKYKHIYKNFCNFLVITSTFKNDTFKNSSGFVQDLYRLRPFQTSHNPKF